MPGMAKNPINTLALKVVRAMCMGLDNKGTGNLAVAPHCLWTVLSMLASSLRNGTRAKDEMIKGLSYETQEGETGAIRWNEELLTTLRMDGVVHLDFSVWAAAASEEYENAMLCKYNALFCGKADMRTINEYVSGKTAGMISQILVEEPNQDPVFLGTTYMKPKWDKQFDPAKTCEDKFFDTDNSHIACMMMKAKMDVEIIELERTTLLLLPYENKDYCAVFAKPTGSTNINVSMSLTMEELFANRYYPDGLVDVLAMNEPEEELMEVCIPKFKVESGADMSALIQKLGMVDIFHAEVINTGTDDMYSVASVPQKVVIEVNESGTKACAAVAVATSRSSMPQFILNCPFVYAAMHRPSGTMLFMAQVKTV